MHDTMGCRHCQGLVAGTAYRCHHCKRWLRRSSYQLGAPTQQTQMARSA